MPKPFSALLQRLDAVYRHEPYLARMKARMLGAFAALIVCFVPINLLKLLLVQPPGMSFRLAFTSIFLTAGLSTLYWLYKGRAQLAGNGIALICVVPVHVLLMWVPEFQEPLAAAVTLFVYDIVCLLMALVFASRLVAFIILPIIVVSQVVFHFFLLQSEPIPGSMTFVADTLLRDGLVAIVFAAFLGTTLAILIETAQRKNEEALLETRMLNENLERLVTERTKDLEAATARASDASIAKSDFLANMSHEIRTPLHAIIASSELLLDRNDLPQDVAEKSRIIAESGDLLLRQIGGILDISKIESGQIELENRPFALDALIRDCIALMSANAEKCMVRVELKLANALPELVSGDSFRLRQILLNLIANAIKFTPEHGLVEVIVESVSEDHTVRVRFEVKDSGIGMDAASLQNIFQRFTQAQSSTSRKYGGSGLGLAICMHLTNLLGGKMEVESEPGKGSRFYFTLPFGEVQGGGETSVAPRVPHAQFDLNVLIADDSATNRKICALQFQRLGCRCSLASDGVEVMEKLEREPLPDLILMDCEMPGMDGMAATRMLRSWATDDSAAEWQKAASRIPVFALTAATMVDESTKCFAAGMNEFLAKPIKLANLENAIQQYFKPR